MRIGSLFSGIGGLELGLERGIPGARVVFQVEIDPFCNQVLRKHWSHAERHEDVRSVGKQNLPAVDLLCGGFPCQDVSSAGARKGLAGERSGLWYEYLRVETHGLGGHGDHERALRVLRTCRDRAELPDADRDLRWLRML